jgi:hypothetical protein
MVKLSYSKKPIARTLGVEGMDEEQLRLGSGDEFWKMIAERRAQKK